MGNKASSKESTGFTDRSKKKIRNGDDVTYEKIKEFKNVNANPSMDKSDKPVRVLVVSAQSDQNFYEFFKGKKLMNGRPIIVEQAGFTDLSVTAYSDSKPVCTLSRPRKPIPDTPQAGGRLARTFIPDFALIRNRFVNLSFSILFLKIYSMESV